MKLPKPYLLGILSGINAINYNPYTGKKGYISPYKSYSSKSYNYYR